MWSSFLCHAISWPFDTADLKNGKVWDPEIWTQIDGDVASVPSFFNRQLIMDKLVGNQDFIRFGFIYAACVAYTIIKLLWEIRKNCSILKCISASGIAWAFLVYTNNFRCWKYFVERQRRDSNREKDHYEQWAQRAVVAPMKQVGEIGWSIP